MKKRIRLTEGQLRKVIREAIEDEYKGALNWKTLMNAAKKAKDDDDPRAPKFLKAAKNAYRNKYNSENKKGYVSYDLCNGRGQNPYEYEETLTDPWWEDEDTDNEDMWWGVTKTQFSSPDDEDYDVDSEYGEDYDSHVFNNPTRNYHYADGFSKYGTPIPDEELNGTSPEFRDVYNYKVGKTKYTPGQGWSESIVRNVTENVIRKLTESEKNEEEIAKSLIGKTIYTNWAKKQKVVKVAKQKDENSEDGYTFVFYGTQYGPFLNLTPYEIERLLNDKEMDGVILVDNPEIEKWIDEHEKNLKENPPIMGKPIPYQET